MNILAALAVTEDWNDFFVASAGASAALAGLVFVAVSINIEWILKYPGLPVRALETLLLLLGALVVSILTLIPYEELHTLGIVLTTEGLLITVAVGILTLRGFNGPDTAKLSRMISRLLLVAIGTVPFAIGGMILVSGNSDGLYWISAGVVGATVGAVLNAWVLLVEIRR